MYCPLNATSRRFVTPLADRGWLPNYRHRAAAARDQTGIGGRRLRVGARFDARCADDGQYRWGTRPPDAGGAMRLREAYRLWALACALRAAPGAPTCGALVFATSGDSVSAGFGVSVSTGSGVSIESGGSVSVGSGAFAFAFDVAGGATCGRPAAGLLPEAAAGLPTELRAAVLTAEPCDAPGAAGDVAAPDTGAPWLRGETGVLAAADFAPA